MRKSSLSATDSTGVSAKDGDPYFLEEDPYSPSTPIDDSEFPLKDTSSEKLEFNGHDPNEELDPYASLDATLDSSADIGQLVMENSTPSKSMNFSPDSPEYHAHHSDSSTPHSRQMTPSRESVSSSFKASTTIVAPQRSYKKALLNANAFTPKSARKTLSQLKSVVASSIKRVYSKEDDETSRIDVSQHSYIEGDSELSIASQSFSAIVTSYTQVLLFNWKTICHGIEKLKINENSVFDVRQDSELEKMMLSDIAAIIKDTDEIGRGQTLEGLLLAIGQLVEAANAEFLKKWMLLFATLRKCLQSTVTQLKPGYYETIRVFWKSQTLVHTCW